MKRFKSEDFRIQGNFSYLKAFSPDFSMKSKITQILVDFYKTSNNFSGISYNINMIHIIRTSSWFRTKPFYIVDLESFSQIVWSLCSRLFFPQRHFNFGCQTRTNKFKNGSSRVENANFLLLYKELKNYKL